MLNLLNRFKYLIKTAGGSWIYLAVLAVLAIVLVLYSHNNNLNENKDKIVFDLNNKAKYVGVQSDDYVKGNASSSVVVIEYIDLECPSCKYFHEKLDSVEKEFINKGVAFVYRSYPLAYLHKQAQIEALAHECVGTLGGKDAYFSFLEKVFLNTKGNDTLDLSLIPIFARELNIDKNLLSSCMKATSTIDLLNSRISRGLSQQISMTPSYVVFLNGKVFFVTQGSPTGLNGVLDLLVNKEKI